MTSVVSRHITASEFEQSFLSLFKADPNQYDDAVFSILDGVFSDLDAYCATLS
jgi:hypothetical protein